MNIIIFSPNGSKLAYTPYDNTVQLWDVATQILLQTYISANITPGIQDHFIHQMPPWMTENLAILAIDPQRFLYIPWAKFFFWLLHSLQGQCIIHKNGTIIVISYLDTVTFIQSHSLISGL